MTAERVETVIVGAGQAGLAVGHHLAKQVCGALRSAGPRRHAGRARLPEWPGLHRRPRRLASRGRQRGGRDRHVRAALRARLREGPGSADRAAPFERVQEPVAAPGGPGRRGGSAAHSGADVAMDVAGAHRAIVCGRDTGQVPADIESRPGRVVWLAMSFMARRVLTTRTTARAVGARDGKPELDDGTVLDVANVVWCTGFKQDFSWIELPIAGEDGWPREERGVVPSAPGLYLAGLAFQYAFSSMPLLGAGRDAAYISKRIAAA